MVALIDLAVHHKVIQLRIFQHRPVVGGDNHAHVVQAHTLPPLGANEILDDLLVNVLCNGVPGIVPLGHDVRNGRHQRRQIFYTCTVGTHKLSPFHWMDLDGYE